MSSNDVVKSLIGQLLQEVVVGSEGNLLWSVYANYVSSIVIFLTLLVVAIV